MTGATRNTVLSFLGFGAFLIIAIGFAPYTATFLHWAGHTEKPTDFGHVVGVNLGQSYAQVGVFRYDAFEIITNEQDQSDIPCSVAFLDGDVSTMVGFDAKAQASQNPQTTVYDARRLIGRRFLDPVVQDAMKKLPYTIVEQNDKPLIRINTSKGTLSKTPLEISALILAELKRMAERYLNTTVRYAVITVPTFFNDDQRRETREAAELTGLGVIRIMNESTALGIAYNLDTTDCQSPKGRRDNCTYLLCQIGEKDIQLTISHVEEGVFEILGTKRDQISGWDDSQISFIQPSLPSQRLLESVKHLLNKAKLDEKEVNAILVTGVTSHISKVEDILTTYFPGRKALTPSMSHDQSIVYGAAKQGYMLSEFYYGIHPSWIDVNPLTLGIEISGGILIPVIPRHTPIPARKTIKLLATTVTVNQEKVSLKILEGQHEDVSGNRLLGILEFDSAGFWGPAGGHGIVSFELDAENLLTVRAERDDGFVAGKLVVDVKRGR